MATDDVAIELLEQERAALDAIENLLEFAKHSIVDVQTLTDVEEFQVKLLAGRDRVTDQLTGVKLDETSTGLR